jgi:hypothetical protein
MSDARNALLSAIHSALAADPELGALLGGARIFDSVPRAAPHPFVAFGEVTSEPVDGDPPVVVRHGLQLFVHSRAAGQREASAIAERVREILDDAALDPSGHRLVALRHRDMQVRPGSDRRSYRARLRFRALTEAN